MKGATAHRPSGKKPIKKTHDDSSGSHGSDQPPLPAAKAKSNMPRVMQNFLLVWLDAYMDNSNQDFRNSLSRLHEVVNHVNTFKQVEKCIGFLNKVRDEKIFMIVSGSLGENIVPNIHNMPQLHSIFVFCRNSPHHEQWTGKYPKVKGVCTKIDRICDLLRRVANQCDHDLFPFGFVSANANSSKHSLDELDHSFMYTQLFKEILLEINYDNIQCNKELVAYCREQYANNQSELATIAKFERDYRPLKSIWWYTYNCFLYRMLNRALRTLDVDTILKMGFFIRNLHQHIAQLHSEQSKNHPRKLFVVYRGQRLSKVDFERLINIKGGLLSFNNFLSTSQQENVALDFARQSLLDPDLVGILFEMTIDPTISSTPFAFVKNHSVFTAEDEILFSMHMVFRVNELLRIDGNNKLWRVKLTLTADNDKQLGALSQWLREETQKLNGWDRLSHLLMQLGQFDKIEQIYKGLLDQPADNNDRAFFYRQLGSMKESEGNILDAIKYYKKALEIDEKFLPSIHPSLALDCVDIARLYNGLNENTQALHFMEKALEINKKILPTTHPQLATDYANIGQVYFGLGDFSKAAQYTEKALELHEKVLPADHEQLAIDCKLIGDIYDSMNDFPKAITFYKKSLGINQKIFPPNDVRLATDYDLIGLAYKNMGQYSEALAYLEKAIQIQTQTLPSTHPSIVPSYASIGSVYEDMGQFAKALSYYQKVFEIHRAVLPLNDPALAVDYDNIGRAYQNLGDYSKALSAHEKSLEISQKSLPPGHLDSVPHYMNLGSTYRYVGDFPKALSLFEKALEIQRVLPPESLNLTFTYDCIGGTYDDMGDYKKALLFHQKALQIREKLLSSNHRDFARSYCALGWVHKNMGEYPTALSFYQKQLEIEQKFFHSVNIDISNCYNNIGELYCKMRDYSKALEYLGKAIDISSKALPPTHRNLAECYNNIGDAHNGLKQYAKALPFYQHAVEIGQHSLPPNHPDLQKWRRNLDSLKKKL